MSSPNSNSESSVAFERLDTRIQQWIWRKGWTEFRAAQEQAIPLVLEGKSDVIICSATASGKTEAAFLPVLTRMLREDALGVTIYVSPLKALINDQWDRLLDLCGELELPVYPWHGDISQSKKQGFLKKPAGVLLITPESLESLFVNRGSFMPGLAQVVRYLVLDEMHAFIGSERGKQLQSLCARLEILAPQRIPRIGLSATLGDMSLAAQFLRPEDTANVSVIGGGASNQSLKILVKGVLSAPPRVPREEQDENTVLEDRLDGGIISIGSHLYKTLRGSNNLIFPGSRSKVELYADLLRRRCEHEGVPNEFWPHHGNLSKEMREETEAALKSSERPATAICTTTLEMGIDIGAIKCVSQVGPPSSIAGLRQRLGRSGRRAGESAILRCYCLEAGPEEAESLPDRLREGLVQAIAVIELLLANWFEPPNPNGVHASTLVQQILSVIAERGGVHAADLWKILCVRGAFKNISSAEMADLLRALADHDLITQDQSGLLLHGEVGEKLVNHYDFYSAFASEDEYRIVAEGKTLGTMPLLAPAQPGTAIIFAGRRWRVREIDEKALAIYVNPDRGGAPPAFDGTAASVHNKVREKMREVLFGSRSYPYLDDTAQDLLAEARRTFIQLGLRDRAVVPEGSSCAIFTWRGDATNEAIRLLIEAEGITAINEGILVRAYCMADKLFELLRKRWGLEESLLLDLSQARNLQVEKWDWALPASIRTQSYTRGRLDLSEALIVLEQIKEVESR